MHSELVSVSNTLRSIAKGEVKVKVEYKDRNPKCQGEERVNYFTPDSSYLTVFLQSYKDSMIRNLKDMGVDLSEYDKPNN